MKTPEEIREEAIKAANRSQFEKNIIYDHKSYEDGFFDGFDNATEITTSELSARHDEEIQWFIDYIINNEIKRRNDGLYFSRKINKIFTISELIARIRKQDKQS